MTPHKLRPRHLAIPAALTAGLAFVAAAVVTSTPDATPPTPPVEVEDLDAAPVVAEVAPTPVVAPAAPAPTLAESPTSWSLTTSGTAMPPLSTQNGAIDPATGRVLYTIGTTVTLHNPATGKSTTVAKRASGAALIIGGAKLGAVYTVGQAVTTAWEEGGNWTATTSITATYGPGVPSGCVDSGGNGHVAIVGTTEAEKAAKDEEGLLLLAPVIGYVVGPFADAGQGDEVTAPSLVCSETGPDVMVWRQQVRTGVADVWTASLDQGHLVGPVVAIEQAFDPHLAVDGDGSHWIGYHAGGAFLTHGSGPGTLLAELGKFVEVTAFGPVVAVLYAEWPTREALQLATSPEGQAQRQAHLRVSLDGGTTWTTREPFPALGYGPCNVVIDADSVDGVCRSETGIAGFEYAIR